MKRLQTRAAAAALSALLLASPACALAAETAPLTLNTQQDAAVQTSRKDLGQLEIFGRRRAYRGVSASDQWLYQARLGGLRAAASPFRRISARRRPAARATSACACARAAIRAACSFRWISTPSMCSAASA